MNKSVIIGAGPVGLFFGVALSAHCPVRIVARPAVEARLRQELPRVSGFFSMHAVSSNFEIHFSSKPIGAALNAARYVLLCVKAFDVVEVLKKIGFALEEDQVVVVCSNGLGLYEDARQALAGRAQLARMLAHLGVRPGESTEVVLSGKPAVTLAGCNTETLSGLKSALESAGLEVKHLPDPVQAEWQKLVYNVPINLIATLLDSENAVLLSNPVARDLAQAAFEEACSVGRAEGIDLGACDEESFKSAISRYGENINSLLLDLRKLKGAGRHAAHTESDFLFGRILRIAEKRNVPIPTVKVLFRLLQAIECSI